MQKAVNQTTVDEWIELAHNDREAFEARRQEAIDRIINRASETNQRRLRGLQFNVDMARRRSSTPYAACLRINSLMWQSVSRLKNALDALANECPRTGARPAAERPCARVVVLRRR